MYARKTLCIERNVKYTIGMLFMWFWVITLPLVAVSVAQCQFVLVWFTVQFNAEQTHSHDWIIQHGQTIRRRLKHPF